MIDSLSKFFHLPTLDTTATGQPCATGHAMTEQEYTQELHNWAEGRPHGAEREQAYLVVQSLTDAYKNKATAINLEHLDLSALTTLPDTLAWPGLTQLKLPPTMPLNSDTASKHLDLLLTSWENAQDIQSHLHQLTLKEGLGASTRTERGELEDALEERKSIARQIRTVVAENKKTLNLLHLEHTETLPPFILHGLPHVTHVCLDHCKKLTTLSHNDFPPKVQNITLRHCEKVECMPEGAPPSSLRELNITGCALIKALPHAWSDPLINAMSPPRITENQDLLWSCFERELQVLGTGRFFDPA